MKAIHEHEVALTDYALKGLEKLGNVIVYGPKKATERGGVISFNFSKVHHMTLVKSSMSPV